MYSTQYIEELVVKANNSLEENIKKIERKAKRDLKATEPELYGEIKDAVQYLDYVRKLYGVNEEDRGGLDFCEYLNVWYAVRCGATVESYVKSRERLYPVVRNYIHKLPLKINKKILDTVF